MNLLPGQVVSIHDALSQMKEFPPPLGYNVSPVAQGRHGQPSPSTTDYQGDPQRSMNQIPPRSNLPVDQLAAEDLLRRQRALVDRELPLPVINFPHGDNMQYNRRGTGREFPRNNPNFGESMDMRFSDRQTSTEFGFRTSTMRPPKQLEIQRTGDTSGWPYMNPTVTVCNCNCNGQFI